MGKLKNDLPTHIRLRREKECFSVINRGKLWYNLLSNSQLNELDTWYRAWLDAPETMVIPNKPVWLNKKLNEQEVLY